MTTDLSSLRVAIVADWLTNFGGAEQVIQSFVNIFPHADIFTTLFVPEQMKDIGTKNVITSSLQKFPQFLRKRHQLFFPFLPRAIESLDLSEYDLVLSSSSFVAKGCLTNPTTLHICYCHTPTRYLWDTWQQFIREFPLPKGLNWTKKFMSPLISKMRIWDRLAAERPDVYIANSDFIAQRIAKYYHKHSTVIFPPVQLQRFQKFTQEPKGDFFFAMGRFTPYKRFDLLIKAFAQLPHKKLKIAGKGPDEDRLKHLAHNAPNIEFLGFVPDQKLPTLLAQAQALLFPQIEDAGISPIEAMATGTPVIALQKGGALNVLQDQKNGIFFPEQTVTSLHKALKEFENSRFNRQQIQQSVEQFSQQNFEQNIKNFCESQWNKFCNE